MKSETNHYVEQYVKHELLSIGHVIIISLLCGIDSLDAKITHFLLNIEWLMTLSHL